MWFSHRKVSIGRKRILDTELDKKYCSDTFITFKMIIIVTDFKFDEKYEFDVISAFYWITNVGGVVKPFFFCCGIILAKIC